MIRSLVSSPEGVKVIPARPLMQLKAFANRDHFHLANTTLVVSRKRISLKSLDKLMALALTVKKLFLSVGSTS